MAKKRKECMARKARDGNEESVELVFRPKEQRDIFILSFESHVCSFESHVCSFERRDRCVYNICVACYSVLIWRLRVF